MPSWRARRVLVLGGLGFIGSNLSRRLAGDGARVMVVTPLRHRHAEDAEAFEALGIRIVEADVRDRDAMARVVEGQEIVFNLAGRSGAVRSMEDPWTDLDVNCRGALGVLEAMRQVNREARLVSAGSRLEYGCVGDAPVTEDRPADPMCVHAIHKLTVEHYLSVYRRLFGIRSVVARLTNPYGPGQPRHRMAYGVVNRMIHLAVADEVLEIYGDGSQRRDYIYIDDAIRALLALACDAADGVYNVGTGVGTSVADMARAITAIAGGGRLEFVAWPELAAQIETGDFVADISRIGRDAGWSPSTPMAEGLERTVAFYRAHVGS
jgi:UDP-glucose 4-epimerase